MTKPLTFQPTTMAARRPVSPLSIIEPQPRSKVFSPITHSVSRSLATLTSPHVISLATAAAASVLLFLNRATNELFRRQGHGDFAAFSFFS